jgi:hypothetical protein
MTLPDVNLVNMSIDIGDDSTPTRSPVSLFDNKMTRHYIILGIYLFMNILPFILPLPISLFMMISFCMIILNIVISYRVSVEIDNRRIETNFERNIRILNPFEYVPELEGMIVESIVEIFV